MNGDKEEPSTKDVVGPRADNSEPTTTIGSQGLVQQRTRFIIIAKTLYFLFPFLAHSDEFVVWWGWMS